MPFATSSFLVAALALHAPDAGQLLASAHAELAPGIGSGLAHAAKTTVQEPAAAPGSTPTAPVSEPQAAAPSAPAASTPAPTADELAQLRQRLTELFLPELGAVEGPLSADALETAVFARLAARAGLDGARGRMHAAIVAGDWKGARELISEILAREEVARAREELRTGASQAALERLEAAVGIVPRDAQARLLRGEARWRVANERGGRELLESARLDFLESAAIEDSADAWYGASRAARALGQIEQARDYALRGQQVARAGANASAPVSDSAIPPQRTLAEANLDAYLKERAHDASSASSRTYYNEARKSLEAWLARTPEDPTVWNELARLPAYAGEAREAQRLARQGLRLDPAFEPLLATLASASQMQGGRDELLAQFAELARRAPRVALVRWYPAQARYSAALERFSAGDDTRELFAEAETALAACTDLDAARESTRAEQLLTCRAGRGWSALRAGRLEEARQAFLSMKEFGSDALTRALDARMSTGAQGLSEIAAAFARRGENVTRADAIDALVQAARLYDEISAAQPELADAARRAGALHREAALALEDHAHRRPAGSSKQDIDAELALARESMEASYRAYVMAAERARDDVRTLADAGGVLARYLQRDPEQAATWLQKALDAGATQVSELRRLAAEPDADPAQRETRRAALEALEIALGDACESLGIVALTLQGDASGAQRWFTRALEHGPDPREDVRGKGGWLEKCQVALEKGLETRLQSSQRWAAPPSDKQ